MNPIFFHDRVACRAGYKLPSTLAGTAGIFFLALLSITGPLRAQSDNSNAELKRLIADISTIRRSGAVESEKQQEKALNFLDSQVCALLGSGQTPDLEAVSQRLADLTSDNQPLGQNYRLVKLGGSPAAYALVVNFGLSGPAAVRIYIRNSNGYSLAAGIDRYSQKDFLDSDVELVPVSTTEPVFVTISGRTDDLSTGLFSAWRFDGRQVMPLWSSDLLQQSSYDAKGNGFFLTYCAQPDEDHPGQCPRMMRDVYRLQAGEWKRTESADLGPEKSPAR